MPDEKAIEEAPKAIAEAPNPSPFKPRYLTDHQLSPLNENIEVKVLDSPGAGGACHHYMIELVVSRPGEPVGELKKWHIDFQNGAIKEAGHNGITQEVLLAIVIDRLRSFQAGPYACRENALALTKLQEGLMWLKERTSARLARGVEGTMEK